ncbi:hypothetical protein M0805_007719 [Coniferiporia weirii]|nr:hypothetical protein M0805_007719 [Coniferiporia weirii]
MPHLKSLFPPIPSLPPLNYHTLLLEGPPGNATPPDFVVHVDAISGEQRTFSQFVERVRDCATALAAPVDQGGLGVRYDGDEQEIIVLFSPNCMDYIVLVHAALVLTVPFAPIASKPTLSELVYLLTKLKSGKRSTRLRLFAHPSLLERALKAAELVGVPSEYIYLVGGHGTHSGHANISSLIENVKAGNLPRQPVVPAQKDTLAYLLFSSGTSGPPKAVMISHGCLCFSIMQTIIQAQEAAKYDPPPEQPVIPQRWLCFLPFYHSFGLHFFILKSPLTPKTMFILPHWNIDKALEVIPKYKITFLALVPSIMHQLVHSPKAARANLSSVLSAGCGAAYAPPELTERFRKMLGEPEKGKEGAIPEGYGLSEATIGNIARPLSGQYGLRLDPLSTGILLPGQEARIIREDGSEADFDEVGELMLKGGNVALGYWGDDEATRETFLPDGWLRTGDRFRVDKTGTFYYEDRLKDTLKVSGAQVAPAEIERVLLTHPRGLLIDAAVAGVPVPSRGRGSGRDERLPRAWVVLSNAGVSLGKRETVQELDAWVREQLSRYKWLTGGIAIVPEIPKNPTGKVLRRVLVEAFVKEMGSESAEVKAKL